MNTKYLTMARRLFCSEWVPPEINRTNRRKWVRSVRPLAKAGGWQALPTVQRKQAEAP